MTFAQACEFLRQRRRFGVKLGLDNMRRAAALLGNPERRLRFIHIAGTNGKGSTAAFCASLLRAAGCRAGLYTSPHLVTLRERIQVDRRPLTEEQFARGVRELQPVVERAEAPAGTSLTFFEIMTLLALQEFAREKADWVVWETGMGGRFDATNIVTPAVSVITGIGLDHTAFLGTTLAQIAGEKAGIIKSGVPVISGVRESEARDVIRAVAAARGSPLREPDMAQDDGICEGRQWMRWRGKNLELGLLGGHQVHNAACALSTLGELRNSGVSLTEAALEKGLKSAVWPGRFQVWRRDPPVVLDGAHNEEGIAALCRTWKVFSGGRRCHVICGFLEDKRVEEMARPLAEIAGRVSLVPVSSERTRDPVLLRDLFFRTPAEAFPSLREAWHKHEAENPSEPVLITGSLFLIGEFLSWGEPAAADRMLNEQLR